MLIQCKLIRAAGTHVELGKGEDARKYHFKPLNTDKPDRDHACEVELKEDIATLLAIPEAYQIHPTELKAKKAAPAAPAPKVEDAGQANAQAGGDTAGQSADAQTSSAPAVNYDKLSKPQLMKLVAERSKKKPHASTSAAKLIEQLQALDAAAAK